MFCSLQEGSVTNGSFGTLFPSHTQMRENVAGLLFVFKGMGGSVDCHSHHRGDSGGDWDHAHLFGYGPEREE